MLPYEERSWAPSLAKGIILVTVFAEILTALWLRRYGPLDAGEIAALILVPLAVIPPNIHVIRLRSRRVPASAPTLPLNLR